MHAMRVFVCLYLKPTAQLILQHYISQHYLFIQYILLHKLDCSVCICLTQLYDCRDMYRIYYIKNNYVFRHFTLAIFRLRNEKLSKQLYLTCVGCIQWEGKRWSGYEIWHVLCRMGGVGTWVLLLYIAF